MNGILSSVPFSLASGSVAVDTTAAKTAIVDGIKSVTTDMTGTVMDALPAIIGVLGVVTVIFFGIKLIKKLTGKV